MPDVEPPWTGHGVLQIAVPGMEEFIVAQNRFYDDSFVSADPRFHHAHITVLAPLTAWDTQAIAEIAASTPPFQIELRQVATFSNGIIHLKLADEAPAKALTRRLWAAHPQIVPNGAPDPTPHLTLDLATGEVDQSRVEQQVAGLLPVVFRAEQVELVWYEANNCHWIASWALGTPLTDWLGPPRRVPTDPAPGSPTPGVQR